MAKLIHLSCGHTLSVRSWPSQSGMKAVRHHYKVHHPSRMRKMTRKSLRTKRKRGLINPFDLEAGISKLRSEYSKLSTFPVSHHSKFRMILDKADDETVKILANAKIKFVSVMARNEMFRRGLTNPCKRRNPKGRGIYYKVSGWDGKNWYQLGYTGSKAAFTREALKGGWRKSQLKFTPMMKKVTRNPRKPVVIYDRIIGIKAQKGRDSNFPGEKFRHDFKSGSRVLGLPDGSIKIVSAKGKRLWKKFDYND